MNTELLNLGAVAIIFLFFLKEFFSYLKAKKNGNGNGNNNKKYEIELAAINLKLGNHLTDVNRSISGLDEKMMGVQTDIKIIRESVNDIKIAIK